MSSIFLCLKSRFNKALNITRPRRRFANLPLTLEHVFRQIPFCVFFSPPVRWWVTNARHPSAAAPPPPLVTFFEAAAAPPVKLFARPCLKTNKVLFVFFEKSKKREATGDVTSGPRRKESHCNDKVYSELPRVDLGGPPVPSPPLPLMTTSKTVQAKQGQTETFELPPPQPLFMSLLLG